MTRSERVTRSEHLRPGSEAFFAPPTSAKSGHALESPASKLGSILLLLAISSVAAVGVLLPDEDDPLTSSANAPQIATQIAANGVAANGAPPKIPVVLSEKRTVPETAPAPRDASQRAYRLASELARQRVTTVGGLTRQQRLATAHEALARVQAGDVSRFDAAGIAALAKRAPESVKNAAFRGVQDGEAKGISAQSQLLVERMLSRESRSLPE